VSAFPRSFPQVRVVYRKYDGSLHWNTTMLRLGEDEHGVWLGSPPGSSWLRGEEQSVVWTHAHVLLMPRDAWWTAVFNSTLEQTAELYCDITTVPQWHDGEVTMVDLDLDVLRYRDGRVVAVDEDEFAEHQLRYGYPPDVIAAAEASMAWLLDAARRGTQPFGPLPSASYVRWLALVEPGGGVRGISPPPPSPE
jgi:protein associated with RNAse G/E